MLLHSPTEKLCLYVVGTIHDDEELLEFASMGTLLEYDLFGLENGLFQTNVGEKHVFMPNDGERIRRIKLLIDNGYLDKLFLAHDIHTKHRLVGQKYLRLQVLYLIRGLISSSVLL